MASKVASVAVLAAGLAAAAPAWAQQTGGQASLRKELDKLRDQLEQQRQYIQGLQQQLQELQGQQTQSQQQVQAVDKKLDETRKVAAQMPLVQAGRRNVKLQLSGQIDRAVNIASDGKNTKAYFVDNNVSNSRFKLDGTYDASSDTQVGATIEVAVRPNNSTQVSQQNESPGDSFDQRKVEGFVKSKTFGSAYLGKGDPSTKDIARLDLSGTDVLAYASVADIAGGLLFVDDDTNRYSTTTVSSAFVDLDPGRQNRVRYDTPTLAGFTASGTYADNERYSGALRWAGQAAGLQATAGAGVSNPNQNSVSYTAAGSASILSTATGLSLTGAGGFQNRNDYNPYFYYAKAGWQASLISAGKSAFSIDFQHSEDRPGQDNHANSIGFAAVQNLTDYGTELYAGLRWYTLAVDGAADPNDIYVGTIGTRIRF